MFKDILELDGDGIKVFEKMVLIVIRQFQEEHDQAFPNVETIARLGGMSVRKVQYVVKYLTGAGLLSREYRNKEVNGKDKQLSNRYDSYPQTNSAVDKSDAQDAQREKGAIEPNAQYAPYESKSLKALKTEEEEYIYRFVKSQIQKYNMPINIVNKLLKQVPDLLTYSIDAIERTFQTAVKRIRTGSKIFNLPKWFATAIENESISVEQEKIAESNRLKQIEDEIRRFGVSLSAC